MAFRRILSGLDYFIPKMELTDVVSINKCRIIVRTSLIISLFTILGSLRGFASAYLLTFSIIALVTGLLILVLLFTLKITGQFRLFGNFILLLYYLLLVYTIMRSGGISASTSIFLVNITLLGFLFGDYRTGLLWGAVILGTIIIFNLMESNGYEFQKFIKESYHGNLYSTLVATFALGAVFERSAAGNLAKFTEERNQSESKALQLQEILDETGQVMKAVSNGDLTQRIHSNLDGELAVLKTSVNDTIQLLGETLSGVRNIAIQLDISSDEVAQSAQSLAAGTSQQADSLEDVTQSMQSIKSNAETNKENANLAQEFTDQTSKGVSRGNEQMEAMLTSMKEINETSANVSKVIKVIDEIAFQTNLLALNAAVEAARAGKYGKSFAVVAEEVRNLASRSAEAVKGTTDLIETSSKEVENGVKNADQTAEILTGFTASIEKINSFVVEITSNSSDQDGEITKVNDSLVQVNCVVQQNSAIAEQTAAATEELSGQANLLQEMMNKFHLENQNNVTIV